MAAVGRLTRELSHERASKLAKEAVALSNQGDSDVSSALHIVESADLTHHSKRFENCERRQLSGTTTTMSRPH